MEVVHAILGLVLLVGLGLNIVVGSLLATGDAPWSHHAAWLKWRPVTLQGILSILFVIILVNTLCALVLPLLQPSGQEWSKMQSMAFSTLSFHVVGLFVIWFAISKSKNTWSSLFGFRLRKFLIGLVAAMVGYLMVWPWIAGYSIVYQQVLNWTGGEPPAQQDVMQVLSNTEGEAMWLKGYMFFFAVVIAPLFEELFFRGYALPLLARRYGLWVAIPIVSILFAAIHGHAPAVGPLFILAVFFSLVYVKTGTLWASVIMHALFNGANLIFAQHLPM